MQPQTAFSSPRSQFFTTRTDPKLANYTFIFLISYSKLVLHMRLQMGFLCNFVIELACSLPTNTL